MAHHLARELLAAPAQENHIVQFYENDAFLAEVVGHFVGAGLRLGEPVIIIAARAHREEFVWRLKVRGCDVEAVTGSGQLTMLDADDVLASFMVGGAPDRERFFDVVGSSLRGIEQRTSGRRIRAYGEMVDLLVQRGNPEAAITLEALWNELGHRHSFSLLCAYDLSHFHKAADGWPFLRVCETHSHVLPAESYTQLEETDSRLREVSQLQQRARALESEIEHGKEIEQQLRRAVSQRDEFLSVAGHELKTPLTAVQLLVQSLAKMTEGAGLPRLSERVAKVTEGLERLGRLVEELVDVSRMSAGRLVMEHEADVDLAALARDLVATAGVDAAKSGCRIDFVAEGEVRVRCESRAHRAGRGQPGRQRRQVRAR